MAMILTNYKTFKHDYIICWCLSALTYTHIQALQTLTLAIVLIQEVIKCYLKQPTLIPPPVASTQSRRKKMLKNLFSEENIKKAGIKLNAAYFGCPKDSAADHKSFFTMEADNVATIKDYLGAMSVEVRPVQPLSEIAKML